MTLELPPRGAYCRIREEPDYRFRMIYVRQFMPIARLVVVNFSIYRIRIFHDVPSFLAHDGTTQTIRRQTCHHYASSRAFKPWPHRTVAG